MEEFLFGLSEKEEKIKKKCELFLGENFKNSKEKFMKLSIIPTFLFYGIPGSGKTSLANKIYKLLREKYEIEKYYLNMESLLSSNFGESSQNLMNFFENIKKEIKENKIYAFIIIDELDSFTLSRMSHDTESIKRVLLTFNKIIDELVSNDSIYNMLIIATTNLENEIDFSVKRRFFFKEDFNIFLEKNESVSYTHLTLPTIA